MSPDLLFLATLLVKMAVAASFVVIAVYSAERGGPVVGAMVATLPVSAGPAYIFLSLDHTAQFIADSALASFVMNAITCVLALVYALLAQRRGMLVSVGGALAIWIGLAFLVHLVTWTTTSAIVFNVIVLAGCLAIGDRLRHVRMPLVARRWYDIPLRAGMVATLVAIVVTISARVGPTVTGILAVFPIVMSSLMIILHPRIGGRATAAVFANSMLGLVGFSLSCLAARLAVVPLGKAAGLALALAVSIGCNLIFWWARRGRRIAAPIPSSSPPRA
ncbi:MAG TPA: hypothetical protein VKX28_33280 [Xanthobacteraceae bacterium]|nr:hypothetical protein [Xanthobacteraceae bacterium]